MNILVWESFTDLLRDESTIDEFITDVIAKLSAQFFSELIWIIWITPLKAS